MKRIGMGLAIVVFLVVVGAILAPFLIDLNRYKPTLLSQIRPYVGREIDFQDIELTILTGLGAEIQGLRIADDPAFSNEDFLTLDRLQVRIRLLPLLGKKVEVRSILIREPVVRIVRNAKGAFNFQNVVISQAGATGAKAEAQEESDSSSSKKTSTGSLGFLAGFLVNELEIQHGSILYRDEKARAGSEPLSVEQLDLKVEDVSLHGPIGIRLSAALMEHAKQNFDLTAQVGPLGEQLQIEKVPFKVQADLQEFPIKSLLDWLPEGLPMDVLGGKLGFQSVMEGSMEQGISSETEVDLSDLVLQEPGEGGEMTGKLEGKLSSKMRLLYPAQQLLVESLACSVNGNGVQMEGSLEQFLKESRWDVRARTENLRPADLLALFPMVARSLPKDLRLDGPVVMQLHSSGNPGDFKVDGEASLDGMKVEYGETFRKAASIPFSLSFEGEKKAANLTVKKLGVKLHQLDAGVSGDILLDKPIRLGLLIQTNSISLQGWEGIFPILSSYHIEGDLYARSSLRGTPENLSANLQAASDRMSFRMEASGPARESSEPIPGVLEALNLEVQARMEAGSLAATAELKAKSGEVRSIRLDKILGRFQLQTNELEILGLELRAYEGGIRSTGRIDLGSKSWLFRPVVQEVSVGPLLDQLTQYKGLFSGKLSGELTAEGAAAEEGQKAAVAANGQFRISEGTLENFNLVESVLDALFGLEGVAQALSKKQGEIAKHEKTRFDYMDLKFDMKDQGIQLNSELHNVHTSKITDSDVLLDGKVGLEDQLLDLKGKVLLSKKHSEDLARQAEALKALLDPEQRMVLPISLKGSISKPIPSLDSQYVLGAMARYYGRKGLEKLGEELGFPKKKEGKKPVEKLLKDLLQK